MTFEKYEPSHIRLKLYHRYKGKLGIDYAYFFIIDGYPEHCCPISKNWCTDNNFEINFISQNGKHLISKRWHTAKELKTWAYKNTYKVTYSDDSIALHVQPPEYFD